MPEHPASDLLKLAEAGDARAQNAVGRFYAEQDLDETVVSLAEGWLRRAADQGLVEAKHNLGVLAWRAGDIELAIEWFLRGIGGYWVPSRTALGALFERYGTIDQATNAYEQAAERGNAEAQDALGRINFALETKAGYKSARKWSELASEQGIASADARLAIIYHEGLGVRRDPRRAASYFLRAARLGHLHAQFMLGIAYECGAGVAVNFLESAFWLSRAASSRHPIADHYLKTRVAPRLTEADSTALAARLREAENR
jgi:TPR repeat protein